jgi:hypothetical protein
MAIGIGDWLGDLFDREMRESGLAARFQVPPLFT